MRENPTMRAALCAAAAILALAGAGCERRPEPSPQPGFTEQDFTELTMRVDAMEGTLTAPAPANILIGCAEDPCQRTLSVHPEWPRICRSGNNCPTQVRWHAIGCLAEEDSIEIAKKTGEAQECFPARTLPGPAGEWKVDSGPTLCPAQGGEPTLWEYGVRLQHPGCPDIVLDPGVIIDP